MLDELVDTLLYEGYALYPYTPSAVKNATPTPFGIVYPPVYAAETPAAHDHLRLECGLVAEPGAPLRATVRFLQATGDDHRATERRIELPEPGDAVEFAFDGDHGPRTAARRSGRRRDAAGPLLRAQHDGGRRRAVTGATCSRRACSRRT